MPPGLTYDEAGLFHHFTCHLGRWLDCTNAPRIFTLLVTEQAIESPVLGSAVMCFSARHQRKFTIAEEAYERCISLLIDRLGVESDSYDEFLLCAVLLLHFADQLKSPTNHIVGDKRHLKGTSSILRASMPERTIDPSATSLRDAAFWIYVRQSLYNATISQEPLDIDFSLELSPTVDNLSKDHPLDWLRCESAWANHNLWTTATIANFCFSGARLVNNTDRTQQWQELWDRNQDWVTRRPQDFEPIGQGPPTDSEPFGCIWFTADWHVISYAFNHFSCILLLRYKPDFKFMTRWVRAQLSPSDREILVHARAICAACFSSMGNPQLLIVLCHTVFIWGPLMSEPAERAGVVRMLVEFERMHSWRTGWIVEALKAEWGEA